MGKILVVEDNREVREIVKMVLARNGFEVATAAEGKEAGILAASANFDLLITDVNLPGMSGAALADKLKENCPGLKVLLMSGYRREDLQGINGYPLLEKPFSPHKLCAAVRNILTQEM